MAEPFKWRKASLGYLPKRLDGPWVEEDFDYAHVTFWQDLEGRGRKGSPEEDFDTF